MKKSEGAIRASNLSKRYDYLLAMKLKKVKT
ncbi:hypothetical protein MTLP_13240 [Candidatus Methanoliparum sp. LAM-1]|nr:hypothetical protein MTLP_13240 [Candidatus Methanoliparum sp. LAM-1]